MDWSPVRRDWVVWRQEESWGDGHQGPCTESLSFTTDVIFLGLIMPLHGVSAWGNAIALHSQILVALPC